MTDVPAETPFMRRVALLRTVWFLARLTLVRRYCGSALGLGWSLLHPLSMIAIYYVVFTVFIRLPITNYFIFLISGLLPWLFINNTLLNATGSLLSRSTAIGASPLNPVVYALADATVELAMFAISMALLLVLLTFYTETATPLWLAVPLLAVPLVVFCYGAAVAVAYLSARFRDLRHILQIGLSALFWLMPIVYHWSMVPAPFDRVARYNPLALLIGPIQVALHGGVIPTPLLLVSAAAVAAFTAAAGYWVYRRMRRDIIFYL